LHIATILIITLTSINYQISTIPKSTDKSTDIGTREFSDLDDNDDNDDNYNDDNDNDNEFDDDDDGYNGDYDPTPMKSGPKAWQKSEKDLAKEQRAVEVSPKVYKSIVYKSISL